ncbi:MAG: PQQ-dependent sugar dehydrogenase [Povalibacter sp.]
MGTIQLQRFTNLTFDSSLALLQAPADNSRWYVVEQGGVVKQFTGTQPSTASVVVDISARVAAPGDPDAGGEMGLLGMAFHPQFPKDPRVFLSYTTMVDGHRMSRVSAFRSPDNGITLDPQSEVIVLAVNQPEANHNGGNIAFGKDGFLYIGFGDGGGGGDRHGDTGNGQLLSTLLGKMLRIDVTAANGYEIPPDNPFAGNAKCSATGGSQSCPEIYAWGFRNPWRWSFDRETQELWVGDVGQNKWEEVDRVVRGGNYGWRCREGAHDYDAGTTGCSTAPLIDPIAEYDHSQGSAITGGYVYRGTQNTAFKGKYLFGDSGSGRIWAWLPESSGASRQPTQLADTDLSILSFGQGNDGELYVVNYNSLHHIVFEPPQTGGIVPNVLSATGCVSPQDAKQAAEGLIPYDVNAPFWSDGAAKQRWIALPPTSTITQQSSGDWDLPSGTVLMKNFAVASKLIETRLFMRHSDDGSWGGYSYAWNDEQTDATLVRGGEVHDIGNGQQWIFPSEAQCLQCHTNVAGSSLGLEAAQLNREFTYPQTARTANQLVTLSHIGVLSPPVSDASSQPRMPDPKDSSASLNDRARAYLHTNCSQCHRPGGPTPGAMDLRYTTALSETSACNVPPQAGDLGLGNTARLIAPGDATQSILVNRMNRRDAHGMPPVGSNIVDAEGVALMTEWINGLTGC